MASLDHRLNPLFSIKECSSCGALYTADFCCSKGGLEDKILVPKPPQNCATCGDPVDGLYCRPCAFVRKCLNEGWYTIHDENKILNTSESSNHNTNVVSAPQEPFVFNQDPGVNSSQSLPQINHNYCYECGDSLDGVFCQQCTSIQAFLKEYDHIPPNEKCMALLLAEERLLKIKQTMEEEQNQPEVMQDMLLKLMDDLQILKGKARDNFLKDVCTFLRKFSRIPFGLTPKVILIAWESFGKIKDALTDKQYQQEDIQELMSKLLKDVKPTEITPDLLIEEPDNSLIMGDEHLDTIPSVENLVPILTSPLNLEYVSLEEVNEDQEEKEFDLEDIFQIQDVILREKLVKISRLITNIESLKDNPTPNHVFKSSFSFPIPVTDSDSFFEESDTSLSHLDNSLPKFETFSDHTEETRRGLISIVIFDNSNDPLLELPEFESFHFDLYDDPSFPRPPPEPPDVEISLIVETDAPVMNNFDELNGDECFDPGGDKIDVEDDDSFIFVIRTFLPFLTYPADSPLLLSTRSEDTIFDPGIST
ncbi:hypothetical protein Tco_0435572 [Tanacetum coccineum]